MAIGAINPGIGLATAAPIQWGMNRINEAIWPEEKQSSNEQIEQIVRDTAGGIGGVLGGAALGKVSRAVNNQWNELDPVYRTNRNLWAAAQREGATANMLDASKGQPLRELQIAEDIKPYEAQFRKLAPYAGIEDVPGESAVGTMRSKLGAQKEAAKAAKQQILDAVDAVGPGISLDAIDLQGMSRYDGSTFSEGAPFVRQKVTGAFAEGPSSEWERAMGISTPKRLTANQVQGLVREIDDEIAKLGGYDDLLVANAEFDPSKLAQRKEHLGALRTARTSLNEALDQYAGSVLGEQSPLKELNATIATALEYDPLMQRYYNSIGQVLTPGSARSMTGPQSQLSSIASRPLTAAANAATGGYFETMARQGAIEKGLAADFDAVNKLQQMGEMYGQPYKPKHGQPLLFKTPAAINEGMQKVLDGLLPILPGLRSIDQTGRIQDPRERGFVSSHVSSMEDLDLGAKFKALSDINAGRLPGGARVAPQPNELPDFDWAYEATMGAGQQEQRLGPMTEDELLAQQLEFYSETDYDESGL